MVRSGRRWIPLTIGLLLGGCGLSHVNESEDYRNQIDIGGGYERVKTGNAERAAYATFVGPRRNDEDLAGSVTGPNLELSTRSKLMAPQIGAFRDVAAGVGYTDTTGECSVWLTVVEPGKGAVEYVGPERLSDQQRDGVANGTISVVDVSVLCDPQADLPTNKSR